LLNSVDIAFAPGLRPVLKHLGGQHDQKTHGNRGGRAITDVQQMNDAWSDYIGNTLAVNYDEKTLKASVAERIADRLSDVSTEDLISASGLGTPDRLNTSSLGSSFDNVERETIQAALSQPSLFGDESIVFFDSDGELVVQPRGDRSWEDLASGPTDLLGRTPFMAGTPEAEMLVRQWATSRMVERWALTSNGQDARALALQEAAAKEFNVKDAARWATQDQASVNEVLQRDGVTFQRFARAQYEETQSMFRDMGISEVVVFRGKTLPASSNVAQQAISGMGIGGAPASVQTRPLSSWSVEPDTARKFAIDRWNEESRPWDPDQVVPIFIRSTIPVSSVLATPVSGVGSWAEREMVTVGTGFNSQIVALEDDWDEGF
jgi:hypothetical protein